MGMPGMDGMLTDDMLPMFCANNALPVCADDSPMVTPGGMHGMEGMNGMLPGMPGMDGALPDEMLRMFCADDSVPACGDGSDRTPDTSMDLGSIESMEDQNAAFEQLLAMQVGRCANNALPVCADDSAMVNPQHIGGQDMPEDTPISIPGGSPGPAPAVPGVPAAPVAPAVQRPQIWICPSNGQPVCAENLATTSAPEDPLAEMRAWCASRSANAQAVAEGMVSVSVVMLSLELTVEDPQAFVNNPSSKRAVEEGIAQAVGAGVVAVEE